MKWVNERNGLAGLSSLREGGDGTGRGRGRKKRRTRRTTELDGDKPAKHSPTYY